MNFLLLQTFVLLLASYFLGAFLACIVKRAFISDAEPVPVTVDARVGAPARAGGNIPPPQPIPPRQAPPPAPPRSSDLVQPKIEVLRRPEPRPAPKLVDPSRFERALMGPDPNEGMPRKAILEIRPAIFKSPTGPPHPVPKPAPKVVQEP